MEGGGTRFQGPFMEVVRLTNEALRNKDECVIFSFMTDGESQEPTEEVDELAIIKSNNPEVFQYFSI